MPKSLALVLFMVLSCASAPALAQDDDSDTSLDDIPHITMLGSAHEEVAPDLATISLGVVAQKPTASAAADEVAGKAQAVITAAKDLGVVSADIQTQALSLTQTYDETYDANGHAMGQKPRGFEASNVVRIRIRNLARVGTIAQMLIQKGANRFDGIEFSLEHPEPVVVRLKAAAVRNAKAQAEAAAQAAGVKLGRVLQIERPAERQPSPGPVFAAQMRTASVPAEMPIEAGSTSTGADVEVTWAIDAK